MQHLLITERHVPADRIDDYRTAWLDHVLAAKRASARAWVFRDSRDHNQFVEFVECDGGHLDALTLAIGSSGVSLDDIAAARTSRIWEEWTVE